MQETRAFRGSKLKNENAVLTTKWALMGHSPVNVFQQQSSYRSEIIPSMPNSAGATVSWESFTVQALITDFPRRGHVSMSRGRHRRTTIVRHSTRTTRKDGCRMRRMRAQGVLEALPAPVSSGK